MCLTGRLIIFCRCVQQADWSVPDSQLPLVVFNPFATIGLLHLTAPATMWVNKQIYFLAVYFLSITILVVCTLMPSLFAYVAYLVHVLIHACMHAFCMCECMDVGECVCTCRCTWGNAYHFIFVHVDAYASVCVHMLVYI